MARVDQLELSFLGYLNLAVSDSDPSPTSLRHEIPKGLGVHHIFPTENDTLKILHLSLHMIGSIMCGTND